MSIHRLLRRVLVAGACLATTLGVSAQGPNNDLVGTWNLTLTSPQGTHPATVDISESDGKLVGKVTGLPVTTPLSVARTDGGVKMLFSVDHQGRPVAVLMTGKVTGATIKGTVDYGGGAAAGEFEATRGVRAGVAPATASSEVSGAWTISSDGGSGWSLELTQAGGAVTGSLKNGDQGVVLPVKGTFEGGALSLAVEGGDTTGTVKATLDGATLKGTYDIGGNTGSWSAVRRS